MLTDVETQGKIRVGKVVSENVSVVGDFVDLSKRDFHETAFRESLKIALKFFRDFWGGAGLWSYENYFVRSGDAVLPLGEK